MLSSWQMTKSSQEFSRLHATNVEWRQVAANYQTAAIIHTHHRNLASLKPTENPIYHPIESRRLNWHGSGSKKKVKQKL